MGTELGALFDAGHDHFDRLTDLLWGPIGEATVGVTRPRPGERVFDACCGAGASALPAARAVGAGGAVDGVDLAERLLDIGRARAGDLPQLAFHRADVTAWGGGPYDLVQCVLGVFFLPDMDSGSRALASRARPGGRFAATVWHERAIHPLPELLVAAAGPEGASRSPASAVRGPAERVNTPGSFAAWLSSLGLGGVDVRTVPHTVPLGGGVAWSLVLGSAMRGMLSGLDAPAVERTRARFEQALAERGVHEVDATCVVGVGRRPM